MSEASGRVWPDDYPEDQVTLVHELEELDPDLPVTLIVTTGRKGLVERRDIEGEWDGMGYSLKETVLWRSGEIKAEEALSAAEFIEILKTQVLSEMTHEMALSWDAVECEDGEREFADFSWDEDPGEIDEDMIPEMGDLAFDGDIIDAEYEFRGVEDLTVEVEGADYHDILFA